MDAFLTKIYFGNSLQDWLIMLGIIVTGLLAIFILKRVLLLRLTKWSLRSATNVDDFIISIVNSSVIPLLYLSVFHFALNVLQLPVKLASVIRIATMIFVMFFILRVITGIIRQFIVSFIEGGDENDTKEKQAKGLLLIINIVIWILGIVFIIDNLGYDVTTIVAGLGIGGIAIALAAQTILGDLFSYFVIFFDRPFEIGDFIIVEDKMGTVEYIGIKTTRLRTLNGEQLICSNTYLTNARVHNYKRMEQRRIVFKLGVTYQTESKLLGEIPEIVKNIIDATDDVQIDRGHFSGFGDFSLDFEFVYYVLSADYNVYMDRQQEIFFNVHKQFEQKKIEFAYPTQTIQFASPSMPVQRN